MEKRKHKKHHLDTKICLTCQRPFNWRKKWERCWNDVKYCSKQCRSSKGKNASNNQTDNTKKHE